MIVDVLWSRELFTNSQQSRHTVMWEVDLGRKDLDIRKQQAFEFVPLDVGDHFPCVPMVTDSSRDPVQQFHLQIPNRLVSLVTKSIEVDQ